MSSLSLICNTAVVAGVVSGVVALIIGVILGAIVYKFLINKKLIKAKQMQLKL